jgi:hypothetical protein
MSTAALKKSVTKAVRLEKSRGRAPDASVPAPKRAARAPAAPRKSVSYWGTAIAPSASNGAARRLDAISTSRFAALVLAIAAAFTLYVGHVHATQDVLAETQRARRENLRLHLKYNRLKGEFDRATGPATITLRARALGLEEGIQYGPTISIED